PRLRRRFPSLPGSHHDAPQRLVAIPRETSSTRPVRIRPRKYFRKRTRRSRARGSSELFPLIAPASGLQPRGRTSGPGLLEILSQSLRESLGFFLIRRQTPRAALLL